MITLPYTDRDFESVFNDVADIIKTIEPRADVSVDKANVESIIAKIVAGVVDTLSYNQDANILEAFPSTAKNARSIFDLLSIVGYVPKTAMCCKVLMSLWNPSFIGEYNYKNYCSISIDGKKFYSPEAFRCAQGITTSTTWYQGTLVTPDKRYNTVEEPKQLIDMYYPNLSINTIVNRLFKLPENHTTIDSRTIKIFAEDGKELKYVENPYLTNITKQSFSLLPSVNNNGYSLMFSKDVAVGSSGDNFYYFYILSENNSVGNNVTPDFSGLAVDGKTPSFSYTYDAIESKLRETAVDARENIVYEFGWRDTPKAIITVHDAERAVLQNTDFISAVDVRDGDTYSKCSTQHNEIHVFCKVNETTELKLNQAVADGLKNRLLTHFNKFKMLPLSFNFHIDDVKTEENEYLTELYYWYPDITIYLKEQVNSQEAAAILNQVNDALYNRFQTMNMNFNEVPRIVDVLETVQNTSEIILYLDIDGMHYVKANKENGTLTEVTKEDITCTFTKRVELDDMTVDDEGRYVYKTKLNTTDSTGKSERWIKYHSVKVVNSYNDVIAFDSGDGTLIAYGGYLYQQGKIDYTTGEIEFTLSNPIGSYLNISYKQETPCFCEYLGIHGDDSLKIALESLKP